MAAHRHPGRCWPVAQSRWLALVWVAMLLLCRLAAAETDDEPQGLPKPPEDQETSEEKELAWRRSIEPDLQTTPMASRYLAQAEHKIVRGTLNLVTAPADVVVCAVQGALGIVDDQTMVTLVNLPIGMTEGVQHSSARALSGAVDILTFWLPGVSGVPSPRSYFCQALEVRSRRD